MAYGRRVTVRSHRRGGKRRRQVRRSLHATIVVLALVGGLIFGYTQLLARTCSGEETLRILASQATANHLTAFATEWGQAEPATADGTCARVVVQTRDSSEVAAQLATGWDVAEEPPPDVWVPAASTWARLAAASEAAAPLIPDLLPSIARTPAVIAMPAPMAAELDWPRPRLDPDEELRWTSLVEEFGDGEPGWSRFDRPEWGEFRFGMGNPARDTAGLLALTAILDPGQDGETTPEELENAFGLSRLLEPEIYHETTEQLLISLAEADQAGAEVALQHISAFPALEQDVLAYNRGNPEVPLVAVYPEDGAVEADHPYLVLNGDWMSERKREVADMFLAHVRSDGPQSVLREAGFRGTNREPGADLVEQNGVLPELVALPREALLPESMTLAVDRWTALTKRLNVLMVFDVSGAMLGVSPATGEFWLDHAKQAATEVLGLFAEDDECGFWEFSTALDGELDHRSLVPMGQLNDVMDDGDTRREQLLETIDGLVTYADSALYNTIQAAYDTVLANYDQDAINMVVVLTASDDDTGGRPGVDRAELLDYLREAPGDGQQVGVATVAFGPGPDQAALSEISELTGTRAYHSEDGFDLTELLRTAVFNGAA